MKRLGILGGTFNPIHTAHLIIAEAAREKLRLDKVLFIPSANPPHKSSENLADAQARLKMINLAITGNEFFESSDVEIKNLLSKSYTVDTIKILKDTLRDTGIFLLIGMDCLLELQTWKEPDKLFELSEVVVLNREGFSVIDAMNEFRDRVKYVTVPNLEISSTEIRKKVKDGKSIKYLVPFHVEDYIRKNKMYIGN